VEIVQQGQWELFDVSVPISGKLVTFPGDPKPEFEFVKRIGEGASANLSRISMGSHTGTHVDAPMHFADGAKTLDQVDIEVLVGPAVVLDMTGRDVITKEDLASKDLHGVERLLFKTDNSKLWEDPKFHEKFTHIDAEAAEYVVGLGVKLVGVDYLSVEKPRTREHATHHAFLDAGVVIIEGLDLRDVPPGDYELFCLPLKVAGAEAAPARVILRRAAG